ncbi:MAG: hypothetical protein ACKOWH_00280 [Rhodoluna sp.]
MINLVGIYPNHLNLNGDFGNLEVLKLRSKWLGYESQISQVQLGETIPANADLIFIGHGSQAAWAQAESHLENLVAQIQAAIEGGAKLLAVASGYQRLIRFGLFGGSLNPISRISKFDVAETESGQVLGYLNSVTDAPIFQETSFGVGSQLHGPLLAKNPQLADRIIDQIVTKKNEPKVLPVDDLALARVSQLVESVWQLELDLARE